MSGTLVKIDPGFAPVVNMLSTDKGHVVTIFCVTVGWFGHGDLERIMAEALRDRLSKLGGFDDAA